MSHPHHAAVALLGSNGSVQWICEAEPRELCRAPACCVLWECCDESGSNAIPLTRSSAQHLMNCVSSSWE